MTELPIVGLTVDSVRIDYPAALTGSSGRIVLEGPVLVEMGADAVDLVLGSDDLTGDVTFDRLVGRP